MRVFIGFDDTDTIDADRGTGKLARWFQEDLPHGCRPWGVVRQQLLVHPDIPYTSHNSSACVVLDVEDDSVRVDLIERAAAHIERHFLEGSDPGLCVAFENGGAASRLIEFGRRCAGLVVTQKDALEAAAGVHLSGHGGTNQGIIGAAAAVGLTMEGWSGRFIEYGRLRELPERVSVSALGERNILVVSMDRDSRVPVPSDIVSTGGWLRPRLWGNRAVLPVLPAEPGVWVSTGGKRGKGDAHSPASMPPHAAGAYPSGR